MERMVKSFEDRYREVYGVEEFTSDAYVEYLAKSGYFGESLSKANPVTIGGNTYGGVQYANTPAGVGQYPTAFTNYTDLTPLKIQNLDATMTSILFKRKNFVLWDWLPKMPTLQTLYEYDKINSYGSGRGGAGFVEGGVPAISLPGYERDNATVRYYGVQRGVTQQSRMIGRAGGLMLDPVRTEVENGTLVLLEKITRSLYFGDSGIKDENGNTVNYDGILQQIVAQNDQTTVIDMAASAGTIGFYLFDNIATLLMEQGYVTDFSKVACFMNPRVLSDYSKLTLQLGTSSTNPASIRQMIGNQAPAGGYTVGQPLDGYDSNFGKIPFMSDLFLQEVKGNVPVCQPGGTPDSGAPSQNISGLANLVCAAAITTGANPGLSSGSAYYWVAPVGPGGEGAPVAINGGASVSLTNNSVQVKQNAGNSAVVGGFGTVGQPTHYRVYRSALSNPWSGSNWIDPNGGLVGHFNHATSFTANQVLFTDTNGADATATGLTGEPNMKVKPGTNNMLILEGSEENLVLPQLTPLLKYNLPPIGTLEPFLLMIYHTIVYKAKKRAIWVKNVPSLT